MTNPLDTDAGSELFSSYEAELKLVQADLDQKLDQIAESTGEQRKAAIRQAERALEEATELVGLPAPFLFHVPYYPGTCHDNEFGTLINLRTWLFSNENS